MNQINFNKDKRGYFTRLYDKNNINKSSINYGEIVNINESFSKNNGTFRGFHMQKNPYQENKILRCVSGSLLNIIICLNKGDSYFGKIKIIELLAGEEKINLVPKGWANSILTTQENTKLIYFVDEYYNEKSEICLNYRSYFFPNEYKSLITTISEKDDNSQIIKSIHELKNLL